MPRAQQWCGKNYAGPSADVVRRRSRFKKRRTFFFMDRRERGKREKIYDQKPGKRSFQIGTRQGYNYCSGPVSVARSTKCAQTPLRSPPGGPPEVEKCDICAKICPKTKYQSACKRLPKLEEACIGIRTFLFLVSTRRPPTEDQTPARTHPRIEYYGRWSPSSLCQLFPASVFLVQPTAPVIHLMNLLPIPSVAACQRLNNSPQTPDFLRSIFYFVLLQANRKRALKKIVLRRILKGGSNLFSPKAYLKNNWC